MTNQYVILAGIITVLYLVCKQIESRYLANSETAPPPLKYVVRDGVLVFGCSLATLFIATLVESPFAQMMAAVSNNDDHLGGQMNIQTGPPNF